MHHDGHGSRLTHRVHQQRDHRDVVKVRMGDEDVINLQELVVLQITHPGACIDQDVVIDQQCRGALVAPTYSATAPPEPAPSSCTHEFPQEGQLDGMSRHRNQIERQCNRIRSDEDIRRQKYHASVPPPCDRHYCWAVWEKNSIFTPAISIMS
jgi:hypothetical protein